MTRKIRSLLTIAVLGMSSSLNAQQTTPANPSVTTTKACVVVSGAVVSPARLELSQSMRVREALFLAKGLKENAGQDLQIVHSGLNCSGGTADNQTPGLPITHHTYNLTSVMAGHQEANPYLIPGDIIIVSEAPPIYIVGNVLKPRAVFLKEALTLTQALTMAGGLLPDSRRDRITINRQLPGSATRTIIKVDLKRIEKRRAFDLVLQPYDIVEVPARGSYSRDRMIAGRRADYF